MGLQEHAGDMEQKPEEDLEPQEEEKDAESAEDAASEVDEEGEKDDAKDEAPANRMEQMVSETIAQYGPQPPIDKLMELALIMGAMPGSPEYDELLGAVDKFCGEEYAAGLEEEMALATAEPEMQEAKEDEGGEPTDEGTEAEAAKDDTQEAEGEQKTEDPAAVEQQGPVAEEVPAELAEQPAVQEELEAQAEEVEEEAPAAEDVKEEKAEEVSADSEGKEEEAEEVKGPPQEDLRRGDKSPEVEDLQNLLVKMGFMTQEEMDTGPGIFGPRTEHALKAYQAELGLPATGFYGPMTRESLATAAQPPSKMEQVVLEIVGREGPKPDLGVMVGVFLTIEPSAQEEFLMATAIHCGEDHAAAVKAEVDNAAAAQAEEQAPAEEATAAEEPAAAEPVAAEEETKEEEKAADPIAAPEELVEETEAPAEEIAAVQEEVVEIAPEVVPEEAKEVVQAEEPAKEEEKEEEAAASPVDEVAEEVSEEKEGEEESAEATAAPEEKEQAAEEEQAELAQAPEEAKVEESEAPEQTEEELEAKKEEVSEELDEELSEKPDNSESIAALQALLEEADRLLAAGEGMLQDPVLDTTQDSIEADAEAMLEKFDGDIDNYTQQLQELADRLTGGDLGQTPGMEEVVQSAAAKAEELRSQAMSLQGAAPASVTVNAQLNDGEVLSFNAPISSRDSAVAEILQTFLDQLECRESESAEEQAEAPAEAPAEV